SRAPERGTTRAARGSPATRRGVRRTGSPPPTPRTARSRRTPRGAYARAATDARATRGCGRGTRTRRPSPPRLPRAKRGSGRAARRDARRASPPLREGAGAVASVGLLVLGRLGQSLVRDGLLELAHTTAERASDLRQPLGAEQAKRDQEQERQVRGTG